jgi:hypothetical protein
MKCITFSDLFRPFAQFLGQAAIVSHFPIPERKLQIPGDLLQASKHLRDVYIASRKQVLQ